MKQISYKQQQKIIQKRKKRQKIIKASGGGKGRSSLTGTWRDAYKNMRDIAPVFMAGGLK